MNEELYLHPDAIVSTDWLEANLNTAELCVFDCTTYLVDAPLGRLR